MKNGTSGERPAVTDRSEPLVLDSLAPGENAGAMSDTSNPFELIGPGVLGVAYFLYAWHKKKTQFGVALQNVKVYVGQRPLRCHVCDGEAFSKREGLINTTWATLFKLDPFSESAHRVVCERCGIAHWFAWRNGASPAAYLRYEGAFDAWRRDERPGRPPVEP
jgi:hypothetical protein